MSPRSTNVNRALSFHSVMPIITTKWQARQEYERDYWAT